MVNSYDRYILLILLRSKHKGNLWSFLYTNKIESGWKGLPKSNIVPYLASMTIKVLKHGRLEAPFPVFEWYKNESVQIFET